jgi:hypothetical protein
LTALLFALLAIDMGGAARDLARSVAVAAIRREFESELPARGVRLVEAAPADKIRLTVSENLTQFLLVAELRRGDERQVLLDSWPRMPPTPQPGPVRIARPIVSSPSSSACWTPPRAS